jgi:hypothetical protein
MDEDELKNQSLAFKLLEKDLNFTEAHEEEGVDEEDDK